MDLSIVIVNWKSKDYLRKCLATIVTETRGIEYEIVIIDSASFDGSEQMVRDEYPQAKFIQSQENLGFARANNLAFQASCGKFLLFLNPDTEVVGPAINTLHSALNAMPQAGAVGAKLLNSDGTLQTSCVQAFPTLLNQLLNAEPLRKWLSRSKLWGMAALFEPQTEPQVVEAISGACIMLPRELLIRVGVFSEDYFMYAEDIDLSYKVSRAGCKCYYVPTACVIHHGGGSSGKAGSSFANIMMCESVWRFFNKTRGRLYGLAYRGTMLIAGLARLGLLLVLFPVAQARSQRDSWQNAFRKWRAVLSWSFLGSGKFER